MLKTWPSGLSHEKKPRPTASVFVYLSPPGHVFNIAQQATIKTYNTQPSVPTINPRGPQGKSVQFLQQVTAPSQIFMNYRLSKEYQYLVYGDKKAHCVWKLCVIRCSCA